MPMSMLKIPLRHFSLQVSESAHRQLTQLLNKHPQKLLQIRVDFGGCHGFQYSFALASVSAIPSTEYFHFHFDFYFRCLFHFAALLYGVSRVK